LVMMGTGNVLLILRRHIMFLQKAAFSMGKTNSQ
jgi:hypothetical protein